MEQERILCAAIHYDLPAKYRDQPEGISEGYVVPGWSHDDIRSTMEQTIPNYDKFFAPESNEGFLTSKNRFVSRHEAYDIAAYAVQILDPINPHRGDKRELTHGDLY